MTDFSQSHDDLINLDTFPLFLSGPIETGNNYINMS